MSDKQLSQASDDDLKRLLVGAIENLRGQSARLCATVDEMRRRGEAVEGLSDALLSFHRKIAEGRCEEITDEETHAATKQTWPKWLNEG